MLQFKKGKSYLKIANPTSKALTIKAGTALGCVSFELIRDLSQCSNTITHLHKYMDGSRAMCSLSISACPIHHPLGVDPNNAHSRTGQKPCNHTPQSHDYPSCAESCTCLETMFIITIAVMLITVIFNENQHKLMMKNYYSYNQDKMTAAQNKGAESQNISLSDIRLSMSDRNIVRKELDLDTDLVLSGNDKQPIRDFFHSMCECLSTHNNPSV